MLQNKIVIAFVALGFCIVLAYNLNFFLIRKPIVQNTPAAKTSADSRDQKAAEGGFAMVSQTAKDNVVWKRDPFRYADKNKQKRSSKIKLQAITYKDGRYSALVNGWVVKAGDKIDDMTITNITAYSVFVKDSEGKREISLYNDIHAKEK